MPHRSLGVTPVAATVAPDVGISEHGVEAEVHPGDLEAGGRATSPVYSD